MLLMQMLPMILFFLCLCKLSLSMFLTMKMQYLLLNEMYFYFSEEMLNYTVY